MGALAAKLVDGNATLNAQATSTNTRRSRHGRVLFIGAPCARSHWVQLPCSQIGAMETL